VLLILLAFIFLIKMKAPKNLDSSVYIITSCINPLLKIKGDYKGDILLSDDSVHIDESIALSKDSLIHFFKKKVDFTSYNGYSISSGNSSPIDSNAIILKYIHDYLDKIIITGWKASDTTGDKLMYSRNIDLNFKMGFFSKTKKLAIPILLTDDDYFYDIEKLKNGLGYVKVNDSLGEIKYHNDIDYVLSEKSKVILRATSGFIQHVFPDAKKINTVDNNDNDIYYFDSKLIGSSFDNLDMMTTTINVEIINPLLNNEVGKTISDWSVGKLISWTIVTLVALFADKIKEVILKPLVQKIFPKKLAGVK